MRKLIFGLLASLSIVSMLACSESSPEKMAPPEEFESVKLLDTGMKVQFNPRVDILFVIDHSMSMDDDQARLSRNIDRFVAAFAENEVLDFHIGITSVYDTKRFGVLNAYDEANNRYPNGQLRPLKDPGNAGSFLVNRAPFLKREPGYLDILRDSLKLGVQPLAEGGPEHEESLSPIVAAFSEPMLSGPNAGFYRGDAHLAVILITDANDLSPTLTPEQVADFMRELKKDEAKKQGKEMYSTFGVIAPTNEPTCKKDPSGDPTAVEQFLYETRGKILSLCDTNYGDRLAEFGIDITRKALKKIIDLKHRPEHGTLKVMYGSQEIPQDDEIGWTYNPETVSVIINGGIDLEVEEGAEISITYTPVDLTNLRNGRAQKL